MKERKLGILGRKVGMTTYFTEEREAVGVSVIELGPCPVLAKRTTETNDKGKTDGYTALQLGFDTKPERKVNKAERGHVEKAGGVDKARRFVRELRVSTDTAAKFELGQEVKVEDLELNVGDLVDVTGRSKGRGFAGVMKRHNFAGFPATHGTHEFFRHGGSIGCRKWPGRVFKGRRMAGHMGDKRVTTQNLEVIAIRPEDNVILVRGSVPGGKNGYLLVRPAIKKNPLP
ncbi:MAG: 50S ribosomal protein L3 [Myxococcota bacterium]|nr:50S ribosomal protein L3 [Myxococcota bacterium]